MTMKIIEFFYSRKFWNSLYFQDSKNNQMYGSCTNLQVKRYISFLDNITVRKVFMKENFKTIDWFHVQV